MQNTKKGQKAMCNHDIKDLIGTKDGIMCRACGKMVTPAEIGKKSKDEPLPFTCDDAPIDETPVQEEKEVKKPAKRGRKAAK